METDDNTNRLGTTIRAYREMMGISATELARRVGIQPSTITRAENGETTLTINTLRRVALELRLDTSDLLRDAGYAAAAELPAFTPYLRKKYPTMPIEARASLAAEFERIIGRYGFDPDATGPKIGEDE